MNVLTILFLTLAVIATVHTVVFSLGARWHVKRTYVLRHGHGATLIEQLDNGLAENARMLANPPWYVRYSRWLTREGKS